MATMNVSLPHAMKEWVESQARDGRYSNASDYVRDLIRRDRERAEQRADLQRLITQGIDSGMSNRTIKQLREVARGRASVEGG